MTETDAEVERLRVKVKRLETALATISDADCPEAPISRETCARVARDALEHSSMKGTPQ